MDDLKSLRNQLRVARRKLQKAKSHLCYVEGSTDSTMDHVFAHLAIESAQTSVNEILVKISALKQK